jgi:hypothetical protein
MAYYRIETFHDGHWTDDPSLLGHGIVNEDNEFADDLEAINAIDDLVAEGFDRHTLRFVEIDSD